MIRYDMISMIVLKILLTGGWSFFVRDRLFAVYGAATT